MDFFFKPRGIALIGATANPRKGGHAILKNLLKGFPGGIYPVNPRYNEILGVQCLPSVASVPDPVDMAIVFIPAAQVPETIEDCAKRGIKGIIIESGGFAETGPEGKALQARIDAIRVRHGLRIWGPNCMGLVDAKNKFVFSFASPTIWDEGLLPGDVSLIVQSGMLAGGFLTDTMTHGTMGVSKVCSIGNKSDVGECDLLEVLLNDPETKAVGLYLESIPDGQRFFRLCRAGEKPVVLLKGGVSPQGAQAAMSHTASMAGDGRVVRGAMAQAGVVQARDFKQMMDLCRALSMAPSLPQGATGRTAILTYSGGAGIMTSDFLSLFGLSVAELSPETRQILGTVYPDWMPVNNPVDLWPAVEKNGAEKAYQTALSAVMADPGVDAVIMHIYAGGFALITENAKLAQTAREAGKPLLVWLLGGRDAARAMHLELQDLGIPVFRELYRTTECLSAVFRWHRSRNERGGETEAPSSLPAPAREALAGREGVLDEHDSKGFLAAVGIPVIEEYVAAGPEEAVAFAGRVGYPVVVKGLLPGEVHKTERGLVRLHLATPEAVNDAVLAVREVVGPEGRVLVQRQAKGAIELICGFFRDPQFGPAVMLGLGGVFAEALEDSAFAVAPLDRTEALALIGRLRGWKILNGLRGAPPLDREALADILVALSRAGAAFDGLSEVDINPLVVENGKPVAVDATVILKDAGK
jgi:acetyltransferase